MEKHNEEKQKKKINFQRELVALLLIIVLVFGINFALSYRKIQKEQETITTSIIDSKTIANEKLVMKNNSEYNRIIEYTFENNIVKTIKIYEQFENKDGYESKKETYKTMQDINIISTNDAMLSIEIEKKELGSDEGLTYEEIYDKYINQLIDIYTVIE